MHNRGNHTRRGWDRHSHKIFLAWLARIRRLRIAGDIESCQAAGTRHQKEKTGNRTELPQAAQDSHPCKIKLAEPPAPRQQCGSHTEGNDVCQRIQLATKVAAGAGHASNASVQTVKQNRKPNGLGRAIETPCFGCAPMQHMQDGVISQANVRSREERRQNIHAFIQPPRLLLLLPGYYRNFGIVHQCAPCSLRSAPAMASSFALR